LRVDHGVRAGIDPRPQVTRYFFFFLAAFFFAI
jgi:hypothetical protein